MAKNKQTAVETEVVPTDAPRKKTGAATQKVEKASKYRGLKSGMRVMAYQDHTLEINDDKKRRLTDEELRDDWRAEFPEAVAFTLEHVRGVRSLYNAGKHTKMSEVPETPSRPYILQDGKRVATDYVRTRKAKSEKATKAAPAETPTIKVRKRKAA